MCSCAVLPSLDMVPCVQNQHLHPLKALILNLHSRQLTCLILVLALPSSHINIKWWNTELPHKSLTFGRQNETHTTVSGQ